MDSFRHHKKLTFRQSRSQLELLVLERTESLQNLSQRLLRAQETRGAEWLVTCMTAAARP